MLAFTPTDVVFLTAFLWLSSHLWRQYQTRRKTSPLNGPESPSLLYGWGYEVMKSSDPASFYEEWADKYGSAFCMPIAMGRKKIILFDPTAIAHFYSKETVNYRLNQMTKNAIDNLIGRGIIWSDGEDHKRQRKILTPAFAPQAIRAITDVFYDSAYKVKAIWDNEFQDDLGKEVVIDVQKWMNAVSLDSIGIAGFSHDFRALYGERSTVGDTFSSIQGFKPNKFSFLLPVLGAILPFLMNLPTKRSKMQWKMQQAMGEIGDQLLERTREESATGEKGKDRSMIGTLVRAETANPGGAFMTPEEVKAQMKTLILAGFETSSIALTRILLELARKPHIQTRLRAELAQFSQDLTYDQLWNSTTAPYLDAVVKESLRIYAPVGETVRECAIDDVVPLHTPVTLRTGEVVDKLVIAAGSTVSVPIQALNKSKRIWGDDAWEFVPERWLDGEAGLPQLAKEIQGFHHLLTFIDGQRTCLGKTFAVTEIKAVLSTLVRNYSFSERDGPSTQYSEHRSILARPQIAGESPGVLPLKVKRIET